MKRIVIIGTSGSGKTTLGKSLGKNLGFPVVDLDDLFWLPNWVQRLPEEFASLIEDAVSTDKWIICGNQSKYRHLIWPKADTIIWLDLPLPILLWRTFRRGIRNLMTQEEFCNGNRESFFRLFGPKSIVLWVLKSYRRHRRSYLDLMKTVTHVKWIHTRSNTI